MRHSLLPVAIVVMMAGVAEAAETGALRGTVTDDSGLAIPGATITLSGPGIAGELATTSDADGNFRFLQLPPGSHQLVVSKVGIGQLKMKVTVRLDETAFAPVVLKVGSSAEILVEETLPVIDTTRSAISTSLTYEGLENLPTGRSYTSAVNMLPGVSGRVDTQNGGGGNGNPSVRGEGQYGNNYTFDGISTRDPATKTYGSSLNFDAIQEMQVYTDGAPAEYGSATGMLVNIVTKDGGDEHHGTIGYYPAVSASWGQYDIFNADTGAEEPMNKRRFFNNEVALTAGGPIVKEKLWYFVGLQGSADSLLTEGWEDGDEPKKSTVGEGFAKLTWFPSPALTIRGQFSGDVTRIDNYEETLVTQEANSKRRDGGYTGELMAEVRPNETGVGEAKFIYWQSFINVTPMSDDYTAPAITDYMTGQVSNNWTDGDFNSRQRIGGVLSWTQLVDNVLGDHKFKAGLEYYRVASTRELNYTGGGVGQPGVSYESYVDEENGIYFPCTEESGYTDCYTKVEYVYVGPLSNAGNIFSGYLQDDWAPIDVVTANLGVRVDREQLFSNAEENAEIYDAWMFSPRLGASWDVTGDSKTQISANAGRYYDVNGAAFAEWGNTKSAYGFSYYENDGAGNYNLVYEQDPTGNPLVYCTEQSLAYFEETDPALYEGAKGVCDETGMLRPYHMDKVVLGFKREILPLFALGVRGILSQTVDLPEDIDFDLDNWVIANPESKRRDYKALEFTAERKFDKHWQLLASYTLSEAKGTSPGQFETASGSDIGSNGNEVGVYLDDVNDPGTRQGFFDAGYGWLLDGLAGLGTLDDDAGWYGYLPYHSFHSVKVNGSYTFNFGTTLGLVYEFDSGHAWQKRGYVDLYQDYSAFPEGRGSRFMPAVNYIDLHLGHAIDLSHGRELELTVDIYNVPDLQAPITYYENDNENFGKVLFRQSPRSIQGGLKFTY